MFPLKHLSMTCLSVRCRHLPPVLLPTSPEHHIRPPVGESRVCLSACERAAVRACVQKSTLKTPSGKGNKMLGDRTPSHLHH
ncbi:hypothetical protein QQF64_004824 [Cirrhinus molitorella]|uniref:Uncharacterized protein n=1 Tax=Cirrhinus molitorella TaxID=172907 RepID=A0ABR3MHC4_9TELE